MRVILYLSLVALAATLFAGCTGLPVTQPRVTLPVSLTSLTFAGSGEQTLVRQVVDLTDEHEWQEYADHIEAYESVGLTMPVTNETGSALNPAAATLRFYLSDAEGLTLATLEQGELLFEAHLPAGERLLTYDSGPTPVTDAMRQILRDGRFYLYVTGTPGNLDVRAIEPQLRVKFRVSVL